MKYMLSHNRGTAKLVEAQTMSKFNPIKRFERNDPSRTLAINAKCAECFGCSRDHLEKGFKEAISSCSSYSCPLHRFRPYQREKSLEGQKIAIQNL
jgi:hypothetical protein